MPTLLPLSMPPLGESVVEGTILKWLKQPGDTVKKDESLLEVGTDKVTVEVPCPADGTLAEILVPEGETVPVGTVLAKIAVEGEIQDSDVEKITDGRPAPPTTQGTLALTLSQGERGSNPESRSARFYSPVIRKLAREANLPLASLDTLPGSGNRGRFTKQDMLAYLERRAPELESEGPFAAVREAPPKQLGAQPFRLEPMSPLRRSVAAHMVESWHTSPHVTTVVEADLGRISEHREKEKEAFLARHGFKLTLLPYTAEAVVAALQMFPILNASVRGEAIAYHGAVHLGVAVAAEQGLVVPVIRNAESLNFLGLAKAIAGLAEKARSRKLTAEDLQGGTFTLTNTGAYGSLFGTPIIHQPQVGILATGAITKRPVVIETPGGDAIAIHPMQYLSLSYDHRVIDGAVAAQFLMTVKKRLETGQ